MVTAWKTERGIGKGVKAEKTLADEAKKMRKLQPGQRLLHYVAVCPGPAADRRPTPARDFHVIDYPDGRYLVRHNDTVLRADPADPQLLHTHLQSALTTALTAYREDNNPTYT